ncbi:hypothetical protein [Bergeyella porcorum]
MDPLTYSKALPDGVYSFCFQAYDWFTKNNLSQKACAIAFFNQYEPPSLLFLKMVKKYQPYLPMIMVLLQ